MTQPRSQQVDALLDEIASQIVDLYHAREHVHDLAPDGVQPAGMRLVKQELHESYSRLAELRSTSRLPV